MRQRTQRDDIEDNPLLAESEDVNPAQYLTNLSDCMLVLAVGFMVALVAAYNVDLPNVAEIQDMTELSDVEEMAQEMATSGTSYNRLGEVYQDPETGKIYMLTESDEATGAGEATGATGAGEAGGPGSAAVLPGPSGAEGTEGS